MPDRKGLPSVVKNMKDREINSSLSMSKKDTTPTPPPLIVVSYSPKKGKNMLLPATAHEDPDIHPEAHEKEKSIVIDFHNTQRCGVDISNDMIKGYSSQPVSYSWTFAVFIFIIYLAAVNARTVLGYDSGHQMFIYATEH